MAPLAGEAKSGAGSKKQYAKNKMLKNNKTKAKAHIYRHKMHYIIYMCMWRARDRQREQATERNIKNCCILLAALLFKQKGQASRAGKQATDAPVPASSRMHCCNI